jgi:hypothetical protein
MQLRLHLVPAAKFVMLVSDPVIVGASSCAAFVYVRLTGTAPAPRIALPPSRRFAAIGPNSPPCRFSNVPIRSCCAVAANLPPRFVRRYQRVLWTAS